MAEYLIQKSTLDEIASQSMSLVGKTEAVGTAEIIGDLTDVNDEVGSQAELISQIASVLEGKAGGSGSDGTTIDDIGVFTVKDIDGEYLFLKGMTFKELYESKMNTPAYYYKLLVDTNGQYYLSNDNTNTQVLSKDGTLNGLINNDTVVEEVEYTYYSAWADD